MAAHRFVTALGRRSRCSQGAYHFVEALSELEQLARAGRVDGRRQLSIANPANVPQQRGDRDDNRVAQSAMLANRQKRRSR
jgi:hypothetical protein